MFAKKLYGIIKENSIPSRWIRGLKYLNMGLVYSVDIEIEDENLTFKGLIESQYGNEVYSNNASINFINNKLSNLYCSCQDFNSNIRGNNVFICKHLIAMLIKGSEKINCEHEHNNKFDFLFEDTMSSISSLTGKRLISSFKNYSSQKLNLEVKLTINNMKSFAEFRIGIDKTYVIKNIKEFTNSRTKNENLKFGEKFTYNPIFQSFDEKDEKIIDAIESYGNNMPHYSLTPQMKKFMEINNSYLKPFMELLIDKQFTLVLTDNVYNPKIYTETVPIDINLVKIDNRISLSTNSTLPIPVTNKGDVVFFNGDIYLLNGKDSFYYNNLYRYITKFENVTFEKENVKDLFKFVVPRLKSLCNYVYIDDEITNNIVSTFVPEFYFDVDPFRLTCEVVFNYGSYENKFIIPNTKKENLTKDIVLNLGLNEYGASKFYTSDDNCIFKIIDKGLDTLKDIGEVYYSDKFKSKKIYKYSSIKALFNQTIDNYLDFNFNISNIDIDEYFDIMSSFKQNKKFYKLKNGDFFDLSNENTQNILELIDDLDVDLKSKSMIYKIPNNKALFINEYIKIKKLSMDGLEIIENISNSFKNSKNLNTIIPEDLNANLRSYQIDGFKWISILDNYGFGGILADEMGLGKTIQTITFLLSKKNNKSLIIVPTSVLFNWKYEFEKFAPLMNVSIVNGDKINRESIINQSNEHQVLITTYGTFKNDLDMYKELSFDYCIIDEAQNIKNPGAKVSKAVKTVNSKCRFALTGTPIENNLLELWSIFDFIMPGYLYSKQKFQNTYMKKESRLDTLKYLIKPFMLRRTKKQVMTELPDKIVKNYFVELNSHEKHVYSSYANEIKKTLSNKDLQANKIVIFSYLTKLRQLCLDPSIVLENYKYPSSKIETCINLIEECIENKQKVLLFSQFTTVLVKLKEKLNKKPIEYYYIDGTTTSRSRLDQVNQFNSNDKIRVFLISLKAGGVGLNLSTADTVIHFDPWWNPSVEDQATDRAHRFGQINTVQVIKLISKGTIEEKILKLQSDKKTLISQFINESLSNESFLKDLTNKEIIDLFN